MLTPEYPPLSEGGVGTHTRQLVQGLASLGCQTYVFTLTEHEPHVVQTEHATVCFLPLPEETRLHRSDKIQFLNDYATQQVLSRVAELCPTPPDLVHCQ